MIYLEQQPQTYQQLLQVEPQFVQAVMSALMMALFAIWVIQQGMKVFRGEEIEKPF